MDIIFWYVVPIVLFGVLPLVLLLCAGNSMIDVVDRITIGARLRRARVLDTYQMFADYFRPLNTPDRIVACVYNKLANDIFWKKRFPVRPEDRLDAVYAIEAGGMERDLLIRELAERCGFAVVPSEPGEPPPQTVRDLVLYLSAVFAEQLPRHDRETLLRATGPGSPEVLLQLVAGSNSSDPSSLLRPGERTVETAE